MKPADEIKTPPALIGPAGKAWRCDLEKRRQMLSVDPSNDGTVAVWIVEAPWAHMAWHSYAIVLLHLRPLKEPRRTLFHLPNATHEMWVQALNPDYPREPAISEGEPWCFLTPNNFAAQFIAPDDAAAISRIDRDTQRICDGRLNPDTDFIRDWISLYGDNMVRPEFKPSAPASSRAVH